MNRLRPSAFSLVEVTISIGILAFCVLAVVGLLPVGLKSIQNANEQAAAAQILTALADNLRGAVSQNGSYSFAFAGSQKTFQIGGQPETHAWTNLTLEGLPSGSLREPARLSARLILNPPASQTSSATATISIAWPAAASPQWNADSMSWSKADGWLTSGIVFLPLP